MGRVLKWSEETGGLDTVDYSLRPQRGAVVVLAPGLGLVQGRRCWSLSTDAMTWHFRWEAIAVRAGVVVVCSESEDDFSGWMTRWIRTWLAPAELAAVPTHLEGATLEEVREYLYDGMIESVGIEWEESLASEPPPPRFVPTTVERLPLRLVERFKEAQRLLFRRGAVHPDGSAEFVAFAMSDRPLAQGTVEIFGCNLWRGAFRAKLGGRSGFAFLEWIWTETDFEENPQVRVWWSKTLESLRQERPGYVVGKESVQLTLAPGQVSSVAGVW